MPIKLAVANQKGGIGKTATSLAFTRHLAGQGKRVLLVDSDSQEAIAHALGIKRPYHSLSDFVVRGYALRDCVQALSENIDVLPSNRETMQAEGSLVGQVGREFAFKHLFGAVENQYDVIVFDVSPSASVIQSCALVYCGNVLVPTEMETLSFWGVLATHELAKTLNRVIRTDVHVVGVLPTKVNRRLQMTEVIGESLTRFCEEQRIPLLPAIRTDSAVPKSVRQRQFLQDFDPDSKALEDYEQAFTSLLSMLKPEAVDVAVTA